MSRYYHGLLIMLALALIALTLPTSQATGDTSPAAITQALVEAADGVAGDYFGEDVALDGDLMVVGAPYPDFNSVANAGAAYLYQRDAAAPSGWAQIKKFTPASLQAGGLFGQSVAVQGDVVAVGAPREDSFGSSDQGVVYIFERDQGGANAWGLAKKFSESVGQFGGFGNDVALDDGLLLVGAAGAFGQKGAAYLFDRTAGWGKLQELLDPASVIGDYFGESVALDGDTVVIGEPNADVSGLNGNEGAALVFQRDQGGPNTWGQVTRLVANTSEPNSKFGEAVALNGDTIVVGAWNSASGSVASIDGGAAFVFERDQGGPNVWGLVKQLAAQQPAASDHYGKAVGIAGTTIWVGAQYSDAGGFTNQGMVYRYERDQGGTGAWGEAATLEADDGSLNDHFGGELDVSGTTIAVGASGHSSDRGAVYAFSESDTPTSYTVYLPLAMEQYIAPNGILPDGGVFRESSGAIVGAVEGTLTEALPVVLVETTAPTQTLDAGAPVGAYYLLAAERVALAPVDKPFLIGLPVPDGVITDDLAMAALLPPGSILDADENAPMWVASMGRYDAANKLFVVTLSSLTPAGMTIVLTQHPDHEPAPEVAAGPGVAASVPGFYVTCASWSRFPCTKETRDWFSAEFEAAYVDFVGTHTFHEPALSRYVGFFNWPAGGSIRPFPVPAGAFFNIRIANGNICSYDGKYDQVYLSIEICLPTTEELGQHERWVVRHELFHAIQYAYPALSQADEDDSAATRWMIEGTATAAEQSSATMRRNREIVRRPITTPLTDLEYAYNTQDFWVYTGLARGQSLAYLQPIFTAGGTAEQVYTSLALDDAYWSWVKNQAIEKTERDIDDEVDADDGFEFPKCLLEPRLIQPRLFISYPTASAIDSTLAPLQSAVVAITFEQAVPFVTVSAEAETHDANLRYKVYDEEGLAGCADLPDDSSRTFRNITASSVRFVVLSNVSASEPLDFVVGVAGG